MSFMEIGGAAMRCKMKLESYLRENGVAYETQHHPQAFTAQEVAASEHIPGRILAKVVIVIADGQPTMLVLPANQHVYLPEVARVLKAKEAHLAEESEFAPLFPDCEVGAMPPFGNLYSLPVYVDAVLTNEDRFYFQAGSHTDTMSMSYSDFARLVKPTVTALTLHELLTYPG
jgi:Ala-tRNA(Pro) deacylase